ncbi:hypothetical protein L7F22_067980 [Adiantum nelumboides]|nr:hypothetical protein [Adiantum nelumboides]
MLSSFRSATGLSLNSLRPDDGATDRRHVPRSGAATSDGCWALGARQSAAAGILNHVAQSAYKHPPQQSPRNGNKQPTFQRISTVSQFNTITQNTACAVVLFTAPEVSCQVSKVHIYMLTDARMLDVPAVPGSAADL